MKRGTIDRIALATAVLALLFAAQGFLGRPARSQGADAAWQESEQDYKQFPVPVEPLPKTITPCRACHGPERDFKINRTRQEVLRVHTNINLNHGGMRVWCLDCHHPDKRDYLLPLSDGEVIPFEESYRLCGKCHGTVYRDWRRGIHGKRTGYWNGPKMYHLCTHCHNPHSPKYKPIEPMPPPHKPRAPRTAQSEH